MGQIFLKKCISEFIGAFAIVFFGCGFIIFASEGSQHLTPLVFGATVAVMIYAVGHLSGAHFNPAVTLAFAAVKRFPYKEVPGYILAQCLGAFIAAMTLMALAPEPQNLGVTVPGLALSSTFLVEVLLTFFLMFVIISVATDSRATGELAGMAIGITVMIGAFVGGNLSGASMNPARTIGPAIVAAEYSGLWIYLLGPAVGAVLAAYVYEFIRD